MDKPATTPAAGSRRSRIAVTVLALGTVSLITDVSSEMVTAILPLYLMLGLHLGPLGYGVVDGLYTGATALLRVAGGYLADRIRRRKVVALAGYGISAVAKLGLLAAGSSVPLLSAVIVADRAGKGLRTAPRDALITLSTPPDRLGRAFGVHRAMDSVGAFLGPLVAVAVLGASAQSFDAVFVTSFCVAALGVFVLATFVPDHRGPAWLAPSPALLSPPDPPAASTSNDQTHKPIPATAHAATSANRATATAADRHEAATTSRTAATATGQHVAAAASRRATVTAPPSTAAAGHAPFDGSPTCAAGSHAAGHAEHAGACLFAAPPSPPSPPPSDAVVGPRDGGPPRAVAEGGRTPDGEKNLGGATSNGATDNRATDNRAAGKDAAGKGAAGKGAKGVSVRAAAALLRRKDFRLVVLAATVMGLATIGDGFVYLVLQRQHDLAAGWFPLLAVGTNLAYLLLAVPLGHLADRVGRAKVYLGGFSALVAVYLLLGAGLGGAAALWVTVGLYGTFYAATDGVLMAVAGPLLPAALKTTGIALVQSGQSLAYLGSSVLFGLAWQLWGPGPALLAAAVVAVAALLLVASILLRGTTKHA
ncbi:MFS transporter [Dactylosporangium sp. CS-047395]|uniref:MFS transporter n=1 Tax=Dactylosporangium sp. CS-047395 TaxID=3239936 RepID=UPI003D937B43